ncbi:Ig-like domain-containing protein [Patescibacteria group bacterium]|nr:Ig-like domain-containing protein [Patescibacteria group bacterium]
MGVYFFFFYSREAEPEYSEVYRLVPEKISQSAVIRIYLPPSISPEFAKNNIKFSPEIKGDWVAGKSRIGLFARLAEHFKVFAASNGSVEESVIYYNPESDLSLNRYYQVEIAFAEGGSIAEDFLAVENPEISAIFPEKGSEVPEDSDITIVFNRPMVPLTTLGELEKKDVPVVISPATEGRFKWITTRNLQFIPDDRLQRSSNYEVKIKQGLESVDGLELGGETSRFTTRNLRYVGLSGGETVYNRPISIKFNQPVDLNRTENEIVLRNNTTGKEVSFIAEYGGNQEMDLLEDRAVGFFDDGINFFAGANNSFGFLNIFPKKSEQSGTDETIINIYNARDRFGRKKLWDFDNDYTLVIRKAYPSEGDINLEERKTSGFNITGVIKNISAESDKTSWVSKDFFDPQGKLWVEFYEDIDLSRSRIESDKLKNIDYGLKCKDEDLYTSSNVDCEKVADKKRIYLEFNGNEVGLGESLEIDFKKIVNSEGLQINKDPITEYAFSYPEFRISKTLPSSGEQSAVLTELIICSNSPILAPAKEELSEHFKANLDYELNYWGQSYRINYVYASSICGLGEFRTNISYGLMPLSNYSLNLKLEDVFLQKKDLSLDFQTGPMSSEYLTFYQFQDSYVVASPEAKNLTFATRNMEYVSVDICKLSPVNFLYYLNNKPYSSDGLGSMTRCEERVKDSIAIPNKYWIKNYFHFDIADYFSEPLGHYVVTFYHPNYKMTIWSGGSRTETQAFERTYLTVTNLGLAEKKIDPMSSNSSFYDSRKLGASEMEKMNNLYWVTNISTLEPEEGARITLYKDNLVQAGTYYTNQEGIGLADVIYDLKGVVVSKGNDSTVIPSTASRINWASSAFLAKKIYLYTDKPIYRPAQEVFIKGIYRIGYDGDYEIPQGDVTLKVYNSKNDEIFEQELLVSNFGTFNTKLILESNAPLGMCRYCVGDISCSYFDVQEYEPAAFDVQVDTNETEYISKDTANIAVEANYYFGVPLEGGQVSYTISSQNYYFDRYTQEYFNFGSGWNYWSSYYGEKFLLRGETSLSEDGKAQISQVLDFETLFKDEEDRKSKILIIDVTVVNLQGQSISSQKSFIVHAGDFYLGIKPDRWFLSKNENFDLKIKSVDTQGKELKVNNLKLKLYKAKWIYSKRQEVGGGYSYKWEKKKDFIKEYDFVTDKSGNYSQQLSISDEGTYEAIVEGEDKSGNMVRSSQNLYVYGQGSASVRPTTNTELELEAVSTSLNVGDIAEVIIKSPYPDSKALISIERGKIFDYEIVEIKGNLYKYEFLVKEEYLPNVYLSVLVQSPKPEVKFGNINFIIDTARKELDIEVSSNKQHYLPGEEVILDITTKDYQNQPVSAEISLSVVDLSVLALKGNINKNPLVFFYSGFPLTISTASNIKNILVEKEITTKGGGGVTELSSPGMAEDDLARKARGEFRETAFWQAVATTDASGKAQIRFTLPDNLTAWQAETLGVTKDSKLGIDYLEFITRKRLMVVPLKPRFVVPGDEFFIGAKVFNQSGENQNLEVKISSDTLVFEDDIDSGGIKDNETNTYYFKAKAPSNFEEGEHQFILSAKANNLEDTIIQHIEIVPNDTYEVAATANYTNQPVTREYVYLPGGVIQDKGNIKIQSSATLAVFISDALNYLLQFPYAGSEQIASKLNAIAIVKRGLNLPNLADKLNLEKIDFDGKEYTIDEAVELGLSKLYNNQNFDGGFSYWGKGQSNLYLGLDVLESFNNLKLAGYLVNQQASDKLFIYLTEELLGTKGLYKSNDLLILASRIIADTSPDIFNSILRQKIIEFANNTSYLQDKASNYVLANLTILLSKGGFDSQLISKVSQVIDNRIEIDSRGAFLEPSQNRSWSYFENTTKNTAIYLKSLSVRQKEDARLDKVVRWLLNSKYKDGSWGSTKNTLAVIEGFVEFLEWKGETESDFSLDIIVNNESKQEFRFNQDTILEQNSKEMALNELDFEKNNIVEFQKENHNNSTNALYYDIALKYYLPIENLGPRDEGFSIIRSLHQLDDKENEKPINNAKVGDVLRVHLQITVPKTREFVAIEDFIPAGMEIVNLDLSTEQKSLRLQERELQGRELIPEYKELYDDRAFLYAGQLRPGVYEFDYFVRALIKGKFAHLPAKISEMYFPENFGRTSGSFFEIK